MELPTRVLSLFCTGTTLVLTVLMLLTFRRERRITRMAPLLSLLVSILILPILILISGARLNPIVAIPVLLVGLIFGVLRGMSLKMTQQDGEVVGQHSLLFLALWGFSLVLSQLLNAAGLALLAAVGLIPVFLATGTQVGQYTTVFLRRLRIHPSAARG